MRIIHTTRIVLLIFAAFELSSKLSGVLFIFKFNSPFEILDGDTPLKIYPLTFRLILT